MARTIRARELVRRTVYNVCTSFVQIEYDKCFGYFIVCFSNGIDIIIVKETFSAYDINQITIIYLLRSLSFQFCICKRAQITLEVENERDGERVLECGKQESMMRGGSLEGIWQSRVASSVRG